jgi:hypothetical protein
VNGTAVNGATNYFDGAIHAWLHEVGETMRNSFHGRRGPFFRGIPHRMLIFRVLFTLTLSVIGVECNPEYVGDHQHVQPLHIVVRISRLPWWCSRLADSFAVDTQAIAFAHVFVA